MSEQDSSVKVAKMALPFIVYIPIITAILLVAGFLGIKLSQIANSQVDYQDILLKFFHLLPVLN